MPKQLTGGRRWTAMAGVVCFVAAGFLSWQLWRPDAPPPPPAAASGGEAPEQAPPAREGGGFELADAGSFADVVDRPLFSRTRRPIAGDDAAAAAAAAGGDDAAATNLSLTGVLLTRGHRVALLRLDNDPKVMHVAEGQEAGGWVIERIQPDKVIVRRGETSGEVILDYRRRPADGSVRPNRPVLRSPGGLPGGSPGVAGQDSPDLQEEEEIPE